MATGGSEETFDFICTPCSKVSSHSEAVVYCGECRECFCQTCYNFHQKIAALVVHKVLDKAGMQAGGAADVTLLPTDTCDTHPGKLIVVYCKDHDALCCVECVAKGHRACRNAVYITEAASGFKNCSQLKDLTSSTNDFIDEVDQLKVSRQADLHESQQDKTTMLTEIHTVTDDLVKRIKELEKLSVDITIKRCDPTEKTLQTQLKVLDDLKVEAQSVMTSLSPSNVNEAQLFINGKRGKQNGLNMKKKLQQNVPKDQKLDEFDFVIRSGIKQISSSLNELQSMITMAKKFNAKLRGEYSMKSTTDKCVCNIIGSCLLPDGKLVLTEFDNIRIKRTNSSYMVTDYCDLPSEPWGVTCTLPGEIAITMISLKKVQFVSTGETMSLTRSFSTSDSCRGLCYSKGAIFVACGGRIFFDEGTGHVAVYNLNGALIRTVQTGPTGQTIFSYPGHVSISTDGNIVFVADPKSGVVTLDRIGNYVRTFSDPSLTHARGLSILDSGHILVCGKQSNNVLQFDSDGRKKAELLGKTDGVNNPKSLCYDSNKSRLVVTMGNTDIIKVFDLV